MSIFTPARRVLYAPSEEAIQVPFVIDRHAGVLPSFATDFAHNANESEYPELWNGLAAFYPIFLGNTGGKVIDLSGHGNTGTLQGTAPSWTSGKFGSAVLLPGTDEHINVPAFIPADNGMEENGLTIVTWVNTTDSGYVGSWMRSIGSQGYGNHDYGSYGLFINMLSSGVAEMYAHSSGVASRVARGTTPVNDGAWHCVIGKVDRGTAKVHVIVDGVEEGTDDWLVTDSFETGSYRDFAIGANEEDVLEDILNGLISHTMIYNHALPLNEIAFLSSNPTALVQLRRRAVMVSVGEVEPPTGIAVLRRRIEAA